MAFGRKKNPVVFDQSNVSMLASQALAERRAQLVRLCVRLTGTAPMLMNRWSQKAITQLIAKMVGMPVPQTPKNLTADYEASYYRNIDGVPALPCRIIKAATIEGAIVTNKAVTKADLKRFLRVLGFTAPIRFARGTRMEMDTKIVRLPNGQPDVRSRAVMPAGWHTDIVLQFPTMISPDQVVAALEGAGSAVGLCEWRPEKGGDLGTFDIKFLPEAEIERVLDECSLPEEEYQIPVEYLGTLQAAAAAGAKPPDDPTAKALAVMGKVNHDAASRSGKPARGRRARNGAAEAVS